MIFMPFTFLTLFSALCLLNVQSGCIVVDDGDAFDIVVLMQSDKNSDDCSATMTYLSELVENMKSEETDDDGANPPADIRVGFYIAAQGNGLQSVYKLGGPADDGSNMNQQPVTQSDIDSAVDQIESYFEGTTECGPVPNDVVSIEKALNYLLGNTLVSGAAKEPTPRYQRIVVYVNDKADKTLLNDDELAVMTNIRNNATSDIYDVYVLDDGDRDSNKALCTKAMYRRVADDEDTEP